MEHRVLTVGRSGLDCYAVMVGRRLQVVDASHLLYPVHADNRHQIIEMKLIAQETGESVQFRIGNFDGKYVGCIECGFGELPGYSFLNVCHIGQWFRRLIERG